MIQPGYLVPKIPLEIAGRHSVIRPLGSDGSLSDRNEAGGGINYYFADHNLKLQLDHTRLWCADTVVRTALPTELQLSLE